MHFHSCFRKEGPHGLAKEKTFPMGTLAASHYRAATDFAADIVVSQQTQARGILKPIHRRLCHRKTVTEFLYFLQKKKKKRRPLRIT